jgi:hypothetical protein
MSMNKVKFVSAFVALTLGMFLGSAYPAESVKQKPVTSHDPAASEVTGRSTHPDASEGSEVKSHDPAASEVTGRSTHPDASEGSPVKSHKEGTEHDRGGIKQN